MDREKPMKYTGSSWHSLYGEQILQYKQCLQGRNMRLKVDESLSWDLREYFNENGYIGRFLIRESVIVFGLV